MSYVPDNLDQAEQWLHETWMAAEQHTEPDYDAHDGDWEEEE